MTRTLLRSRATRALTLLLFLGTLGAPAVAAAAEKLRHYGLEELSRILAAEGYGSIEIDEDHVRFKADGRTYGLYLYEDGDLQMYFGVTGVRLTARDMNEWNKNYRLSRAYLDHEGDPVLEADLLANAGINHRIISEFVKVFIDSSMRYRSFVMEHDRGDAPPASRREGASF